MPEAARNFPYIFPVFFIALWLAVTVLLSYLAGRVSLVRAFPDLGEAPLLRLSGQSGKMGMGVNMNGILTLSVCPSGLRVGIMRLFGPFSRDFFVPWDSLSVVRRRAFFMAVAKLQFGGVGALTIPGFVADRLARAAGRHWPESGPFPSEEQHQTAGRLLTQWAILTGLVSAFFIGAILLSVPSGAAPPIAVAILFPALVFGAVFAVRYFRERNLNRQG